MDARSRGSPDWEGNPMTGEKDVYTIHNWSALDEALRLYPKGNVELFVHQNASLRFASEFVEELKTGPGAEDGYLVLNPAIAYCKADVFECLHPHVKALGLLTQNIRTEVRKVEAAVSEMWSKYGDAKRNVFVGPSPEAQVFEPLIKPEKVYLKVTSKSGLERIAAAAQRHLPILPEKCTSVADMTSSQPSEADLEIEVYLMNLQYLQGKLKFLLSFEEQVKKIHLDMEELLLGNTPLGSAKTVMDFVDVTLVMEKPMMTGDGKIKIAKKSPKSSSANRSACKSPSPAYKTAESPSKKQAPADKTALKSPFKSSSPAYKTAESPSKKSPATKRARTKE